jgi:hypothetical protein
MLEFIFKLPKKIKLMSKDKNKSSSYFKINAQGLIIDPMSV